MHSRQSDEAADHCLGVDLIDVVERTKFASVDLAGRGCALVVQRAVGQKRSSRWAKDARRNTGIAHRDGDDFPALATGAIDQVKDGNTVDDLVGLNGDL